jgi:hypothetical protein
LQEYIYSFKYGEDGIIFEVNASSKGKAKDKFSSADAKVRRQHSASYCFVCISVRTVEEARVQSW